MSFPRLALILLLLAPAAPAKSDLEKARDYLRRVESGSLSPRKEPLLGLRLADIRDSREASLGRSLQLLSVSGGEEGGLLLFGARGKLLVTLKTGSIESLQILDLDGDGTSEVLTEELTGRGTGIVGTEFCLYKVRGGALARIWRELAYEHFYAESPRPQERRIGFVRPLRRAGSYSLLYSVYDAVKKQWRLREFVLSPTGVREEKVPLLANP